jgi:hypothetical protein
MFKLLINWLKRKRKRKINYSLYRHKWFPLHLEKALIDYVEKKARELAETELVPIYSVLYEEINKNETIEDEYAVGRFVYHKDKSNISEYYKLREKCISLGIDVEKYPEKLPVPRIEITERAEVFTLIHELGHYFLYKRDQTQTELDANLYVEEFFDTYLPPFFKWIYQIEIKIRTKKELIFTDIENYTLWNDYNEWIKNNIKNNDKSTN